jgi:hypothetical protein
MRKLRWRTWPNSKEFIPTGLHIRQKYGLKWSKGDDSIQTFERFNDDLNFDTMLQQVKQMIRLAPMYIGIS